jgi:AraC-like DNA-binding protein
MGGISEESDFTMPLPGGGSLHVRRRVRPLPDGLTWIEEEMEVEGRLSGAFATGPGWIFELHTVSSGAVSYVQDGARVPVRGPRFALLYAPYSVTELHFDNVRTKWVGLAGQSHDAGESLVLDVPADARPATPEELLALRDSRRDARSVERCTQPSACVRRAKAGLDVSYRKTPSIASLAAGLGVSQPHLTRQFKRELGMTPVAYRHALRSSEAAGRLSRGEPVSD